MEVFKTFGTKLEVHNTRAYVDSVSYEEATAAAQQLDWNQFHLTKNNNGTVNASFILGKEVSDALWAFIGGNNPGPLVA